MGHAGTLWKVLACVVLVATCLAVAQSAPSGGQPEHKIWLKSGVIDVASERRASFPSTAPKVRALAGFRDCPTELGNLRQYIVTFEKVTERSYEDVTKAFGGEGVITSYLPDNSYLVFAKPDAVKRVTNLATWVGDFRGEHKVSGDFVEGLGREFELEPKTATNVTEVSTFFDVHLPHNLGKLKLRSCRGKRLSEALTDTLCQKAKSRAHALACFPASSAKVVVRVAPGDAASFVSWAAEQSEVHSISHAARLRQHNHHANSIMQCGAAADDVDFESDSYQQEYLPAWTSGLKGENQIVGIGDSGLSHKSCFFRDDAVNVKFEKDSTGEKVFYSKEHRKIDMYRCHGDCKDSNGHGTHVAGTLAGESASSTSFSSQYDGVAPKSRIAFTDMGKGILGSMKTPSISEDLFPRSYERGVRIHSDSWSDASTDSTYGLLSMEVDKFTWENQDFLSVFPTGNDGASNYYYNLNNPAVAKNVIAVGATMNYSPDKSVYVASGITMLKIFGSMYFDVKHGGSSFNSLEAQFGGSTAYAGIKGDTYGLVQSNPLEGCSALVNADSEVKDKVVLMKRGNCRFTEKVRNAQKKGAKAVIIYNNREKGYYYMGADKRDPAEDITIPSYSVSLRYGTDLLNALEAGNPQVTFEERAADPPSFETLAEYSSVGPTIDDRIKPDLVAPGNLVSAGVPLLDRKSCFTTERSGTSMAVPVVAGAAVLIRQYFTEGRHKIGDNKMFTSPSGALIKAVLLNGAKSLEGYAETGYPMNSVPSPEQGFGRVLLKDSLPLDSSFQLFVQDAVPISSGEVHSYCVETGQEGPLGVTLTWFDPPADLLATKALVNDLDLKVHSVPRNHDFLGNQREDRANTVEQVKLAMADKGRYIIEVRAHQISQPGQSYALVASGQFLNEDSLCSKTKFARILNKPARSKTNQKDKEFILDVYDSESKTSMASAADSDILCKFSGCGHLFDVGSGHHDWKSCGKSAKYTNLGEGNHCFSVRYDDPHSTQALIDDSYIFTVKTIPPVSSINFHPASLTGKRSAVFTFSTSDNSSVSTFRCQLTRDGSTWDDWKACSSPVGYNELIDGDYVFTVKARDDIGNEENVGSSWSWTVDTKGPRTVLKPPATNNTNSYSVSYEFSSPDQGSADFGGFECIVTEYAPSDADRNEAFEKGPWQACGSPLEIEGLTDGFWTFGVRAYDKLGNYDQSPEHHDFEIDRTAPWVQIVGGPPVQTNSESLVFHFVARDSTSNSNDANLATECSFGLVTDPFEWEDCKSPKVYMNIGEAEGLYHFMVRAQDQAGNTGHYSESYVHIDRSPPEVNVTYSVGYGTSQYSRPILTIRLDIDDGPGSGVGYTNCRLKKIMNEHFHFQTGYRQCDQVAVLDNLEDGSYFFEVTAQDKVGNSVFYISEPILIGDRSALEASKGKNQTSSDGAIDFFGIKLVSEDNIFFIICGLAVAILLTLTAVIVQLRRGRQKKKSAVTAQVIGIPVQDHEFNRAYSGPSAPLQPLDVDCCTQVVELAGTSPRRW